MKKLMVVFVFLIASVSPGFAQTQIDAATRQDVEDLIELTGARERIPLIYSAMAGKLATGFAARYPQQHPKANPAEVQKAATAAAERFQQLLKAIPSEELLDAMIPVYQRYFTHSDIKAINEFYGTPTAQKLLQNTNNMMLDAIGAAQAVVNKHMPEIEAQIDKTAADLSQPALTQSK
ncbi:MAG TPA: DUF2059 domain-containing protein [Terriglobales bacterium]